MSLTVDSRYNYHLSTLYSSSFVKSYLNNSFSDRLYELLKVSKLLDYFSTDCTLEVILAEIYQHLSIFYRSEYVYKNAVANELLLANHSLYDAKLFTEFIAEQSLLDVLIVNGTTTAYEIKTELDTLDRLPSQLKSYQSMFDKVYVVTCEQNVAKIKKIVDEKIGIQVLNSNNKIDLEREPISNKEDFITDNIFFALRKDEYLRLIKGKYGYIPQVPNTKIFGECLKLFKELSRYEVHDCFVEVLRSRALLKHQIQFIESVSYSLKMLFLERNLSKNDCSNLTHHLQSKPL
ncbi:sce7726 family protein [Spirosoma foliorum]|uniref:Sce7726 family protein n=1 Tax=Spirosoma foliorum TaxID=2710596 RepID=A0A7G5GZ02_9BACT|nr:sce7726 family protein [Spirosoma foliorum]QMW04094.1 sce7726 family protein [Spirosoma foliorum]